MLYIKRKRGGANTASNNQFINPFNPPNFQLYAVFSSSKFIKTEKLKYGDRPMEYLRMKKSKEEELLKDKIIFGE